MQRGRCLPSWELTYCTSKRPLLPASDVNPPSFGAVWSFQPSRLLPPFFQKFCPFFLCGFSYPPYFQHPSPSCAEEQFSYPTVSLHSIVHLRTLMAKVCAHLLLGSHRWQQDAHVRVLTPSTVDGKHGNLPVVGGNHLFIQD